MNSAAPIQCTLRPSALLAVFLFLGHGLALVSVIASELPVVIRLGLSLLLGLSLCHSLWRVWHPDVKALIAGSDGRLQVESARRAIDDAEVLEQTLVLSWLIVLRYRLVGERRSRNIVFLPDSLADADAHRLLRRWLRWKSFVAAKAATGSGAIGGP